MSSKPNSPSSSAIPAEIAPVGDTHDPSSSLNSTAAIPTAGKGTGTEGTSKSSSSPQIHTKPKPKPSFLSFLHNRKAKPQLSDSEPDDNTNSTRGHSEADALFNWIAADLKFIQKASETIKKYEDRIGDASNRLEQLKGSPAELRELKKTVTKLKLQISSKSKDEPDEADTHRRTRAVGAGNATGENAHKSVDGMPKLYKNPTFERSSAFRDFEALYDGLKIELKLCLLCFSVFPENAVVKRRLMIYWWIGEGFVNPTAAIDKKAEELANDFFKELLVRGFIQPVHEKCGVEVHSCRMHPFIRSAVIMLAERNKFFDFDPEGNVTGNFSDSLRACLVGKGLANIKNLEQLHMVFNFNEAFLEFKYEWFLKMRNVNVLYLGRWQVSVTHHIEVEDTKFLEGMMNMKHLRFFSLQGVSRITELPDSISQLSSLTILDLRACHNLEVIPDGIGLLKSLRHLDMSECYLLEHMPKGLASLSNLRVLKGFVVGDSKVEDSCTLIELAKLPKLEKLNIYTGLQNFPTKTDLHAFQQFKVLRKLTITWGGGSLQDKGDQGAKTVEDVAKSTTPDPENKGFSQTKMDSAAKQDNTGGAVNSNAAEMPDRANRGDNKKKANSPAAQVARAAKKPSLSRVLKRSDAFKNAAFSLSALPSQLEKLDLQCFPQTLAPSWLMPANLKSLKKLYVRGGKLRDLGQFHDSWEVVVPEKVRWKVEVLRLKYLTELEMDWRELQELFPELIYLEKVKCPKLTLFPCNERGVWMNKTKKLEQSLGRVL